MIAIVRSPSTVQTTETVFSGASADLEDLRQTFDSAHCLKFESFLGDEIAAAVRSQLKAANFDRRHHEGIGTELCVVDSSSLPGYLNMALNDPDLFGLIEKITGCGPIGCFTGRVYQLVESEDLGDDWHDDLSYGRLIALSLNLSHRDYGGGELEIRTARKRRVLTRMENQGWGDAVVFRLRRDLQHRVAPVTGPNAKIAFAGWFRSHPKFPQLLAGLR